MSWLLFVDESGQDRRASPYEVLAGVAINNTQLWPLVTQIRDAKSIFFGSTTSLGFAELKARTLLKAKVFRQAAGEVISQPERAELAAEARIDGSRASHRQLTALAQAKIAYCAFVLSCCEAVGARFFASIVDKDAPYPAGRMLRKDYSYLFERFFYLIDEQPPDDRGLVVFDEIERSKAHLLVDQMAEYFQKTATGRQRSGRVIPEPLFVHSDLSTLIQIADLVAYVVAWNIRVSDRMNRPRRPELDDLGNQVLRRRHLSVRDRVGYPKGFRVWSFALIDDLRPRAEVLAEVDAEQEYGDRFAAALDDMLGKLQSD